jgi:tetratricopeptide (TPR) repeat protein
MKRITIPTLWALLLLTATPAVAQDDVPVVTSDSIAVSDETEAETVAPVSAVPDQLLSEAIAAYDAGRYTEAIAAYEQLAETAGTSAALNYNLAGAYYKDKQYARAILHYERALLQDPADEDAAANLEMARANTVDKIEAIEPVIFVQWSHALRDRLSTDAWAWTSIVLFLIFIVGLFLYFFLHAPCLRRLGFFGGLLCLVLSGVAMSYASAQRDRLMVRDHAIVMSPTVTVRSSPADSGTQLFTLHEGTKVSLRSTLGTWMEIELADGNVGWIPAADLEVI